MDTHYFGRNFGHPLYLRKWVSRSHPVIQSSNPKPSNIRELSKNQVVKSQSQQSVNWHKIWNKIWAKYGHPLFRDEMWKRNATSARFAFDRDIIRDFLQIPLFIIIKRLIYPLRPVNWQHYSNPVLPEPS